MALVDTSQLVENVLGGMVPLPHSKVSTDGEAIYCILDDGEEESEEEEEESGEEGVDMGEEKENKNSVAVVNVLPVNQPKPNIVIDSGPSVVAELIGNVGTT